MYTEPWKVPAKKRIRDPRAPKRPMSAFLFFSNAKRAYVKNEYKDAKNAEVSRILAQIWKDADAEVKKPFIDEEFGLRQLYKIAMTEWKRQAEEVIKAKREKRENEAMKAVREGKLPISDEDQRSRSSSVCSATDSTASMGSEYSTKMADYTFAPALANPYRNKHQYSPAPSARDQKSSTDSYNNANTYSNLYGVMYQAPASSSSSSDAHDRSYEGGPVMGYGSYGQPHPYGYAPQINYQQGTYDTRTHVHILVHILDFV